MLRARVQSAAEKRRRLQLPSACGDTTAYRLVNSEGDRISGLIVDVFGSTAVVQSGAAWCEVHRASIESAVLAESGAERLVWKRAESRLQQDGWAAAPPAECADDFFAMAEEEEEDEEEEEEKEEEVLELGLRYAVSLAAASQKTGFYCDQRENRALVRDLVRPGDRVLDLCCYSGGFSLNAAKAGAGAVVGVDSSRAAVDLARRNARLNGFASDGGDCSGAAETMMRFVQDDIVAFMDKARVRGDTYDLLVLVRRGGAAGAACGAGREECFCCYRCCC